MESNLKTSNLQNNEIIQYMRNVNEFKNELDHISKTWEQLILFSKLSTSDINMSSTKENFDSLRKELTNNLVIETLKKVISDMNSKAQVAVDIVIRNLFERTADIGFLATDRDIRDFLNNFPELLKEIKSHRDDEDDTKLRVANMQLKESIKSIRNRFEEYVSKYSVYFDILLFDKNKNLLVKMQDNNQIKESNDEALELARTTSDEYVETYKKHDFLPNKEETLVYTYKVTKTDESDEIIGFLSLCFKFKDEMSQIFENLVERKNKEVILLLDKSGNTIATSDKYHVPVGANLETNLDEDFKITQFAGRDYIIKTCDTNGYEGFYGLGWLGHIMIPLDSAFNIHTQTIELQKEVLNSIMENDNLFEKELLEIPQKAEFIQGQLDRSVWNGNLIRRENYSSDLAFTRTILREIKSTGEKTKKSFNTSIEKLNQTIITSLLDNVTFLASLSIDIMDRNLYERANDCRWWALTASFRDILSKESINEEDVLKLESVLKYINNLYTVYTNLLIFDTKGKVLAVSNNKQKKFVGETLTEKWIEKTLRLTDSSKYAVSFFEKTSLYDDNHTYIYSSSIKNEKNQAIGAISVVFDSQSQFQDMLIDALPKDGKNVLEGVFSLFVEKINRKIVSCSNNEFEIGKEFNIDSSFYELKNGESLSKILEFNGKYYIVGAKCSSGYREYKSSKDEYRNDVLAFVFIEAGIAKESETKNSLVYSNELYNYQIAPNEEFIEVATFYIGEKWLGIDVQDILESINIDSIEEIVSLEEEKYFKGTVVYKSFIVSVIDIYSFIRTKNSKQPTDYNDIILVQYEGASGEHKLGLTVSKLAEIIKVPKRSIKNIDTHFIDGGMIGESVIVPPDNVNSSNLLTLINISKIGELDIRNDNIV